MLDQRIKTIQFELENAPDQHYIGPTAIQVEYHRRYANDELLPVRTIGKGLSDLGLSNPNASGITKGAAQNL